MTRVRGERALERKLTKTIPRAVRRRVAAAMEKSAAEIVALAVRFVPVKDGDLRKSIGWTWGAAPEGSVAIAQSPDFGGLRITIYAGNREAF